MHRHNRYAEQLYVVEGEFTVWAGKQTAVLHTGDAFTIPAGTAHAVAVTGDGPGRVLVVASPSGFARLITEVSTPDEGGEVPPSAAPDMERFLRVSAELGDEILGPPGAPARLTTRSCGCLGEPDGFSGSLRLSQQPTYGPQVRAGWRRTPGFLTAVGFGAFLGGVQSLNGALNGQKTEEQRLRDTASYFFTPTLQRLLERDHDTSVIGGFKQDFSSTARAFSTLSDLHREGIR